MQSQLPARRVGRARSVPSAWLVAATVVALVGDIVLGWSSPVADAAFLVMPYQMLIGDFARAGELLHWNPWVNGGSPDGVEPQFGARSPLVLALAWLGGGTPASFTLLFACVWALGAAGMARLARHLGAPSWAQFAIALAWAANGALLGHASHPNIQHGIAFLPWAVLGLDRALLARGRTWPIDAAVGGMAFGLGALAGYPGVTVIGALFLGCWAVWRACGARGERASAVRVALSLPLFVLVGVAVMAPSHVGFVLEASGYTYRESALARDLATGWRTSDPVGANALEPRAMVTAFHPGVAPADFPRTADRTLQATDPTSAGLHVGLGTWTLAILAVATAGRRARWIALLAIGVVFLMTALGGVLPLRAWLYDLVPPTRYFRHASLFRIPFLLVLAVLAAEGARRLAAGGLTPRAFPRAAFVVAVVGACVSVGSHLAFGLAVTPVVVLWWLVAHLGLVGVAWWARRDGRRFALVFAVWFAAESMATFLVGSDLVRMHPWRTELLASQHVRSIEPGAAGFHRHLFAQTIDPGLIEAVEQAPDDALRESVRDGKVLALDSANLVAKRAALLTRSAMGDPFHALIPWNAVLRAQALGSDRVFFANRPLRAPLGYEAFGYYIEISSQQPFLLLHGEPYTPYDETLEARIELAALHPQPARIARYRANELVLELDPPPASAGWIYVTERFAPGWRAAVDGHAVPIERAGFVWRAVPVTAGAREVVFEYRPKSAFPLLVLSWGTIALVACASIARAIAARRHGGVRL